MDVQVTAVEQVDLHALFEALPERGWLAVFFLDDKMLVSHFLSIDIKLHVLEHAL